MGIEWKGDKKRRSPMDTGDYTKKKGCLPAITTMFVMVALGVAGCEPEDKCINGTQQQIEQNRFRVCVKGQWTYYRNDERKDPFMDKRKDV